MTWPIAAGSTPQRTCWQCHTPVTQQYSLTWGNKSHWDPIGYYCSRECLAEYINLNWDEL